jgi:HEAT repeat protein
MKKTIITLCTLLLCTNLSRLFADPVADSSISRATSQEIVEQMRGVNMQLGNLTLDDGKINLKEQCKELIIEELRTNGKESVTALIQALKDSDVQMRRNAELVMISLAEGYDGQSKMDLREAVPALIKATEDADGGVRAWAAHALAEIGPDAKSAVPALIKLLKDSDEGCRNDSCMALGDIGPAASEALPGLQNALNDPSKDVRQFAKVAIEKIKKSQ